MEYTLSKVIGALLQYHRLKKSGSIDNIETYMDIDKALDTFSNDVKKGVLEIFADGKFASMSEKKVKNYKPILEELVRTLNGNELGRTVGGGTGTGSTSSGVGYAVGGSSGADEPAEEITWENW